MSVYMGDHAFALAEVTANGKPVTFTRTAEGYNPATDLVTPSATTVSGHAVQIRMGGGVLERFRTLGLVLEDSKRLLFAPTTFGATPVAGDRVTWAGESFTVRDVETVSPDGTTILAYVTVGR